MASLICPTSWRTRALAIFQGTLLLGNLGCWSSGESTSDTQLQILSSTESSIRFSDTFIRELQPNKNEGGAVAIRLRDSGNNRGIIRFDHEQIRETLGNRILVKAELEETITENGKNWRPVSQALDLHRLTSLGWTEYGATWNCPQDLNTSNNKIDCDSRWIMASGPSSAWAITPSATARISKAQTGGVRWDLTTDLRGILKGSLANYGYLLKKTDESDPGEIEFGSQESQFPPRLILTYATSPYAKPDWAATFQGRAIEIDVLGNDETTDGTPPELIEVGSPAQGGSAKVTSARKILYTPEPTFVGTETFTYTVKDSQGQTKTTTVEILVTVLPAGPTQGTWSLPELTIRPIDDAQVRKGQANENYGKDLVLRVSNSDQRKSLIRFSDDDLALLKTLPSFVSVRHAKLNLEITDNTKNWGPQGRTVSAFPLHNTAWNERQVTWNCATDADTSNRHVDCAGQAAWNLSGGIGAAWSTPALASLKITSSTLGRISFDLTSTIRGLARTSATLPSILIQGDDEAANGAIELGSRESGTPPELKIEFITSNLPPDAHDDTGSVGAGLSLALAVLENDSDPDSDDLSIVAVSPPMHGTALMQSDGTILYTPADGFAGQDSFQYAVSDHKAGQDIAEVRVTVTPDTTLPVVFSGLAQTDFFFRNPQFETLLTVQDQTATRATLYLDGAVVLESMAKSIPLSLTLVGDGVHIIQAVVVDAFGNTTTVMVATVTLDRVPPTLLALSPRADVLQVSPNILVTGRADETLSMVSLNGTEMSLDADAAFFSGNFKLTVPGKATVQLLLVDLAGNTTQVEHTISGPTSILQDAIPSSLPSGQGAFRLKLTSSNADVAGVKRLLLPIFGVKLVQGTAPGAAESESTVVDLGKAAESQFALSASAVTSPGSFSEVRFNLLPGQAETASGTLVPVSISGSQEVRLTLRNPVSVREGEILELFLRIDLGSALTQLSGTFQLTPIFEELKSASPTPLQSLRLVRALGAQADVLMAQASNVVEARVTKKSAALKEIHPGLTIVVTDVTASIIDDIGGTAPAKVNLAISGGSFGEISTVVSHGTKFDLNEGAILLLHKSPQGYSLLSGQSSKVP